MPVTQHIKIGLLAHCSQYHERCVNALLLQTWYPVLVCQSPKLLKLPVALQWFSRPFIDVNSLVVEPYHEVIEDYRVDPAEVKFQCISLDDVVVTVDVMKEHRILGEYAEVYIEDFIPNAERYSRSTASSATKLSVLGSCLLHVELFPC